MPSIARLQDFALFAGISEKSLQALSEKLQRVEMPAAHRFVQEGEKADTIFFIESGEVEIVKAGDEETTSVLGKLSAGDSIGEIALLGSQARSASIQTTQPTTLLSIKIDDLHTTIKASSLQDYAQFLKNAGQITTERLLKTNALTAASMQREVKQTKFRISMAQFFTKLIAMLCIYAFFLAWVHLYADEFTLVEKTLYLPLAVIIAMLIPTIQFIYLERKTNKLPLSFYGLTFTGWREATKEALLYTLPVLVLIVIAKWLIFYFKFPDISFNLFDGPLAKLGTSHANLGLNLIFIGVYILFAPAQEFVARGVIQGSLGEFLGDKNARWQVVILSNLIFSSMHLSLSINYALVALIPGLFWGWLYTRHRSLVGVSISHALIGLWTIYVVGLHGWVVS